ncbi:MAG: tRNA (N(6)-L-threonylcarbamoyladenosine(37)-C(2))-methylthiotransferase MtaB [Ruminococcus sp.]|nr:tRNA (N(6)-L-threonylcarbamoyladenosine(37)-C(2))-methylthiotransferase MtaB [Ruminococcus sp.]
MKIYYFTFGCKVNQYETEHIRETLEAGGDITVNSAEEAEVCIVNSCTVTAEADKKCRQFIHRLRRISPDSVIVCAGCMTQAHADIADRLPGCDIIVGSHNKNRIPGLIKEYLASRQRIIAVADIGEERCIEPMLNRSDDDHTRAYIKIQDGCDMSCAYCIIPRARGHIRSKPLDALVSEARGLIASGHKEIILTGINLCCYGRENGGSLRLSDAVEAVSGIEAELRVRLSSLEPELITGEDIERWAALDKLCPHFHLSLQSGCDRTLKAMNRHYTAEQYAELCEKLRQVFPGCGLTTDIMVGFPGETEEDHRASLAFAERIGFSDAHIFPYSRRPGTPADAMPGQLPGDVKARRAAEMAEVCRRSREKYLASLAGTVQRVLFEKESSPDYHQGHSDSYAPVRIPRQGGVSLRREFRSVLITGSGDGYCFGTLIE